MTTFQKNMTRLDFNVDFCTFLNKTYPKNESETSPGGKKKVLFSGTQGTRQSVDEQQIKHNGRRIFLGGSHAK